MQFTKLVALTALMATAFANPTPDDLGLTLSNAAQACYWDGTSPFCAGSCPSGYTEEDRGSCGDGACCWTGIKTYCCKGSVPDTAPETPQEQASAAPVTPA